MSGRTMQVIAEIESDFGSKFGIPRQSGLAGSLEAVIRFRPDYASPESLRGLEMYSHLWLIWEFSATADEGWSPTVRPPRLGGNRRLGVFATRAPFRPNPIGLSSVRLLEVLLQPEPLLRIAGADLMDGTPIYDIKPYIGLDCHPEATGGLPDVVAVPVPEVICPPTLLDILPPEKRPGLLEVLRLDPRPRFHQNAERIYGIDFAGYNVRFQFVDAEVRVLSIERR